jgi:hypothetical protein
MGDVQTARNDAISSLSYLEQHASTVSRGFTHDAVALQARPELVAVMEELERIGAARSVPLELQTGEAIDGVLAIQRGNA